MTIRELIQAEIVKMPERNLEELYRLIQHLTAPERPPDASEGVAGPLSLWPVLPPLRLDEGGAVRVGASRINLDLVVEQYENGMTPEDMARTYDALELADVHAAIAFYLRHRDEVRAYVTRRKREAEALQRKIEGDRPPISREDLLARRGAKGKAVVFLPNRS